MSNKHQNQFNSTIATATSKWIYAYGVVTGDPLSFNGGGNGNGDGGGSLTILQ